MGEKLREDEMMESAKVTSDELAKTTAKMSGTADEMESSKDGVNFQDEVNYAAARDILNALVKMNLLEEDEIEQIDEFLRNQFSPVFTPLIADYPAF